MANDSLQTTPEFLALQTALAGRYSLEREIGRGGMGIVFLAREVALDRMVALKLLPPELAARPGVKERFLREARTAARLSHPNIVPIYTVDEVEDFVFFVMAYIEGGTLGGPDQGTGPSDLQRRRKAPEGGILGSGPCPPPGDRSQRCEAGQHPHGRGIRPGHGHRLRHRRPRRRGRGRSHHPCDGNGGVHEPRAGQGRHRGRPE